MEWIYKKWNDWFSLKWYLKKYYMTGNGGHKKYQLEKSLKMFDEWMKNFYY